MVPVLAEIGQRFGRAWVLYSIIHFPHPSLSIYRHSTMGGPTLLDDILLPPIRAILISKIGFANSTAYCSGYCSSRKF